ncbi:hypothetical protein GOODEAATRI_021037, partial [Goodea atripinnis]
ITARLTDCSHQCAAQVAAATNNTAFLAYSISKKAREMGLPPEDVEEFCNFADTIRCRLCGPPASLPGRPCYSDRCGFGSPPPFPMILKESY